MFGISLVSLFLTLLLIFLITKLIIRISLNKRLPPGPNGVPFVGIMPPIHPQTAHLTLTEWGKKYGPVFSFYNGNRLIVVLSELRSIRDALVKQADVFTGRPRVFGAQFTHKYHGLLNSDGARWKEQRRFALSTLRDFGFGKPILENKIREEQEFMIEEISKLEGRPADFQMLLNNSVSNIICALVFGQRFEYTDANFITLLDHFSFVATRNGQNVFSYGTYFPIMRYFPAVRDRIKKGLQKFADIDKYCQKLIQEHKESFHPENDPEDYIHAFMATAAKDGGAYFYDFQLLQSVISLFVAGTETTSTTLRWAILLVSQNLDVQEKVRAEISNLVGPGNTPGMKDRQHLPYTEATIYEVQRVANLVPLSLPHRTEADAYLDGYLIPKDTTVIPLLWAVHRDPKFFPNPEKFDPERFLEDGKLSKGEPLIPFSVGKRACLGESLARMELFLFFTTLIQKFRFELPPDSQATTNYETDRVVGVTSAPLNFDVCAKALF